MQNTPDQIIIRPGSPEDFDAVRALDRELIAYDLQFDPSLDAAWSESTEAAEFFQARLSGDGVCLVAERDGELVGCLMGALSEAVSYRRPTPMAELETLFVRPEIRGGGVGRRLMSAFADWVNEHGAARLTVRVSAANRDALRFYEREGFAAYDVVLERG